MWDKFTREERPSVMGAFRPLSRALSERSKVWWVFLLAFAGLNGAQADSNATSNSTTQFKATVIRDPRSIPPLIQMVSEYAKALRLGPFLTGEEEVCNPNSMHPDRLTMDAWIAGAKPGAVVPCCDGGIIFPLVEILKSRRSIYYVNISM